MSDEEHLCHKEFDLCNVTKHPSNMVVRRDNEDASNARNHSVPSQNLSVAPISLTLSQKRRGCLLNEHHGSSKTAVKRQKKSSGTYHYGSSSSPIGNSEVDFGSSGEPSNVRSVRIKNSRTAGSFSRIIDIDDFSNERSNGSHNRDCSRNSESEVRAIQVKEDEILALELQEQLYNESNVAADHEVCHFISYSSFCLHFAREYLCFLFSSFSIFFCHLQIDDHIALELQQGSFQNTLPSGSHHESHPVSA